MGGGIGEKGARGWFYGGRKKSDLGVGSGLRGHIRNSAWFGDEAVLENSGLGWYGGRQWPGAGGEQRLCDAGEEWPLSRKEQLPEGLAGNSIVCGWEGNSGLGSEDNGSLGTWTGTMALGMGESIRK